MFVKRSIKTLQNLYKTWYNNCRSKSSCGGVISIANKRMFSMKIIDTDLFIEMPQSTRLLYYELCMRADDDGFVASPNKIRKITGCSEDDYKILMAKQYIIPFESGICVIKHWRIHNLIRVDRYNETEYLQEKSMLVDNGGKYEIGTQNVIPKVIPDGTQRGTQVRVDKVRVDKNNSSSPKLKFTDEQMNLAVLLNNRILQNKPNFKSPKSLDKWAVDVRLMVESDKRDLISIEKLINWCQSDSFWRTNILSMATFRKQFDMLEMKMNSNANRQNFSQNKYEENVPKRKKIT